MGSSSVWLLNAKGPITSPQTSSLLWQCHPLPRLSIPPICCWLTNSDFQPQTYLGGHLSTCPLNESQIWYLCFSLPKPIPSPVFPISICSIKHGQKRDVVLDSYIPYPVGPNSPEWELDPTAGNQQVLIISHSKDDCKLEPEQTCPSFWPLASSSSLAPKYDLSGTSPTMMNPTRRLGKEKPLGGSCLGREDYSVHKKRCHPPCGKIGKMDPKVRGGSKTEARRFSLWRAR